MSHYSPTGSLHPGRFQDCRRSCYWWREVMRDLIAYSNHENRIEKLRELLP